MNETYIYVCWLHFTLDNYMPFHAAHENTEPPPLSQGGEQERSATRATQFPRDQETTLRERPNKLVVARGGECDTDRNPVPPKSPARSSPAGVVVTLLYRSFVISNLRNIEPKPSRNVVAVGIMPLNRQRRQRRQVQ